MVSRTSPRLPDGRGSYMTLAAGRRAFRDENNFWETNMGNRYTKRSARRSARRILEPARTTVGAAVFCALYGMPHAAHADPAADSSANELAEITVTATRREEKLE